MLRVDKRLGSYEESFYQQAFNGKVTLSGTQIPADYRAYLDMGRFRNALILDELKQGVAISFGVMRRCGLLDSNRGPTGRFPVGPGGSSWPRHCRGPTSFLAA